MKPYCYGRNIGIQRVGVKKNANDLLYALRSVVFAISPRAPCTLHRLTRPVYLAPSYIFGFPCTVYRVPCPVHICNSTTSPS